MLSAAVNILELGESEHRSTPYNCCCSLIIQDRTSCTMYVKMEYASKIQPTDSSIVLLPLYEPGLTGCALDPIDLSLKILPADMPQLGRRLCMH